MPVIQLFRRLRKKDYLSPGFETRLGNVVRKEKQKSRKDSLKRQGLEAQLE